MDRWLDIAVAALDHAGVKVGSIKTLVTWDQQYCANAIYQLDGQHYLKLFGPGAERQFHVERTVLQILEGHPVVPAPRIAAVGEPSRLPPYLILTAIPGDTAEQVWDGLQHREQLAIARELATIIAAIHRLPLDGLAGVERQFGGRIEYIKPFQVWQTGQIEANDQFSVQQRDDLLRFMHQEAPVYLNDPVKFSHCELAHNHIYLAPEAGTWRVTGIIDWADAMLGPPEWDHAYLWHWTFTTATRYLDAMRVYLQVYFDGRQLPEHFARRCLAAMLHTYSMRLLWPGFLAQSGDSKDIVLDLTAYFYPPDVFGPPD